MERTQAYAKIGNEWQASDKRRIYFNDFAALMDLEIDRRPGRMEGATINGETISCNEARGILRQIAYGKIWFDFADGRFHYKNLDEDVFEYTVAGINRKADALIAEAEAND